VGSGEEALEAVAELEPDVILLDLKLPGVSGEDVLRRLGENGCRARVLVISGTRGEEAAGPLYRLGARDYLQKPFGIGQLKQRLDELLRD
jgi:DNA-binding response OmpR family regulator